jgi:hypothetical protein
MYSQTSCPNVFPYQQGLFWEEIIERSIQCVKSSGSKKLKPQSVADTRVETTEVESGDGPEPKEVMMIEVTWM